jgi:tRNA-splicing ligase RtcB
MRRVDENRVVIETPQIDIALFANDRVFIDNASVKEAEDVARICYTVDKLKECGFLSCSAGVDGFILTPDFHKGAGVPIGTVFVTREFVIPAFVGSDIGCGMRFLQTDVTHAEFEALGTKLDEHLRYIFFEGGRNIPLSAQQRAAMFRHGLAGLSAHSHSGDGIFEYWSDSQQVTDLANAHLHGGIDTTEIFNMGDFIKGSGLEYTRDDQIGSIGGGNHFCEFQVVLDTYDRHKAYHWGLVKNNIAIMVHSGSVGIGHVVGNHFTDFAREIYPTDLRHEHPFYILPNGITENFVEKYLSAMANAANFAFANRLFLGLMMVRALSEALGRKVEAKLVYDAPHNLIWEQHRRGKAIDHPTFAHTAYIHRKGACPADYDMPVIIPGSMGSDSFLMVGQGLEDSFCSACHGAGRTKPRQQGRSKPSEMTCRVVTKVDPKSLQRRDIRDEYMKSLAEEAPDKYKDISPIIDTIEGAGIARRVARTFPLLTVKGL